MQGTRGGSPYRKRMLVLAPLVGVVGVIALAGMASAISLQKNTYTLDADFHVGGSLANQLPSALGSGDWNRDGYGDVVMCSSVNNSCGIWLGRPMRVSRGLEANRPEVLLLGPGGDFGQSAAFVGDVNNDGYDDLVIGAPALVGPGTERLAGSAWLFLGRGDSVGAFVTLGYYQAATHFLTDEANATLGTAVAAAGDLDGDGRDDFWVGAGHLGGPAGSLGSLYLYHGRDTWPAELGLGDAILEIDGVTAPSDQPPALLGAVDLDGDLRLDLAVGSDRYPNAAGDPVGAVFVFLDPYALVGSTVGASSADVVIRGTLNISGLGGSLAFAQDFMLGGLPTLMVSADYNTTNASTGGGVFLYRTGGWACCRTLFGWDAHGLLYSGWEADGGNYTLSTGDFDGDGWTDLAVGAHHAPAYALTAPGVVYLFYGREIGTDPVPIRNATGWVNGPHHFCLLGRALTTTDFNRDGKDDFFAGCPLTLGFELSKGDVFGFLGRPRNRPPIVSLTGPSGAVEGDQVNITVTILDPDNDRVTWGFDTSMVGSFNSHRNRHQVNFTLNNQGPQTWRVQVVDGEFAVQASHSFSVVNAAPTCSFEVDVPFDEGKNRSVRVVGQDRGRFDVLHYTWSGPENMTVNGTVAWYTPPRGQPFLVRVDLRDEDGGFGSCVYNVPVINGEPQVELTAPSVVPEGSVASFYADVHDNGSQDEVTLVWRTPDGIVEGPIMNWVPKRQGVYVINFTARDLDGAVVYRDHYIRVTAVAPDVELTIPSNVREGERATLTVVQHTGESFDPITVSWHICGHPLGSGLAYTLLQAQPGDFCVEALVIDDDGQFEQLRGTLHVINRPPLDGVLVTPPDSYFEGAVVHFEVVLAPWETADFAKINVTWRVDGRIAQHGHEFYWKALAGTHTIEARARDPAGATSAPAYTLEVLNVPPTIYIQGPATVRPGVSEEWRAFAADPSGTPVSIEWRVDGTLTSHGETMQWGSLARGSHTISATATDGTGDSSVATFSVTIEGTGEAAGFDLGWIPYALTAAVAFAVGIFAGRIFDPHGLSDRRRRRP